MKNLYNKIQSELNRLVFMKSVYNPNPNVGKDLVEEFNNLFHQALVTELRGELDKECHRDLREKFPRKYDIAKLEKEMSDILIHAVSLDLPLQLEELSAGLDVAIVRDLNNHYSNSVRLLDREANSYQIEK